MSERSKDVQLVIIAGEALFGSRWQTELARALKLTDARRIRQWLSGERPVPSGISKDLYALLEQNKSKIDDALSVVSKNIQP